MKLTLYADGMSGPVHLDLRPLPSSFEQVVFVWDYALSLPTRRRLSAILEDHAARSRRPVGPFTTPYERHRFWSVTWCGPVQVGSELHQRLVRTVPPAQRHALHAFDVLTGRFRFVSTSQPFAGSRSQSAKPVAHDATAHAPAPHVAVALGSAHARPHAPQLVALDDRSVSHPLDAVPSQSPKPPVHRTTVHAPAAHPFAAACERAQTAPHAPQFVGSIAVFAQNAAAPDPSVPARRVQRVRPLVSASRIHWGPDKTGEWSTEVREGSAADRHLQAVLHGSFDAGPMRRRVVP